ncbi:MAG: choice-of-anchor J domain-containing protein [Muribaculaceae bacterium]|nr:choice-of-anchor J domain-containing protein [Muribaculaceae bacterium]
MKLYKTLLAAIAIASTAVMTGCDEDFDRPPVIVPEATIEANTTILELKERYWQDPAKDYMTVIGLTDEGEDIVISGIIISSDVAGNVYQRVMIQDETSAITIRVYNSDLSTSYHYGQELRMNVSGLLIGTYRGLQMIGVEYNGGVGGMDLSEMTARAQVNGLPNEALVQPYATTIPALQGYKNDQKDMCQWQTRLVTLENVSFVGGGKDRFGDPKAANYTTTQIQDADGNKIDVSTSNKCTFAGMTLPEGTGTVTAILSYFGSNWQLVFNDPMTECVGFEFVEAPEEQPGGGTTPGEITGAGTKEDPFTVNDLLYGAGSGTVSYVTGYIVGWVDGASISEGAKFTLPATNQSNILIAATQGETNYEKCVPVQLVFDTQIRNAVNLVANPDNFGKQLTLAGSIEKYFGVTGIKSPTDDFILDGEGSTPPPSDPSTPAGNAIYSALGENDATTDWTLNVGTTEAVWSWTEYSGKHYLNASAYGMNINVETYAVSPVISLEGKTTAKLTFDHAAKFQTNLRKACTIVVREQGQTAWTKLTVPTWPEAGSWTFVNCGSIDLSAFAGKKIEIGFLYVATPSEADTWEIRNLKITE